MASEVLFPARQRCRTCGKALGRDGAPVLKGLYDTPRCAGMAEPVKDLARAPRECRTQRDGSWEWKRRYRSVEEIPRPIREDATANWYECGHCGHLHVGHSRIDLATEKFRVLAGRAELADLLVKSRGRATVADVAKVLKVPQVRIKEWEDPSSKCPDVDVLFKLLAVYRLKVAAVFRQG